MKSAVAVVVNWNGFADTQRCVGSLRALEYPEFAIVVVDNGSTDGSAERIAAELPDVALIRSQDNRGFAGGANLGIGWALDSGADYVWLLNNDTEVDPAALDALVAEAERDDRVGIVGGVLPDAWGGGRIGGWTGVSRPSTGPGDPLDYVAGACMLVRREVFAQVGLLDESFFFYFEDADFCLRAREAGWKLAVAPGARVAHKVGASVNRAAAEGRSALADRLQLEASARFLAKHAGRRLPLVVGLRSIGIAANRARRGQFREAPRLVGEFVRAVRAGRATPPTRRRPASRPR